MKTPSFFVGIVFFFVLFSTLHAQDFVPGQIMIDIKHEYLPITPTPNGDSIIVTGLPSIDSFHLLSSELFLNFQQKILDKCRGGI
jgi:hypothetical protein